jgi:hypothetical protein
VTAACPAGPPTVFELELSDAPDALLRVLDLFAVQGARLGGVSMRRRRARMSLRVEVEDMAADRSERLQGRLGASLFVLSLRRVSTTRPARRARAGEGAAGSARLDAADVLRLPDPEARRPAQPSLNAAQQARAPVQNGRQDDQGDQAPRQPAHGRDLSHA